MKKNYQILPVVLLWAILVLALWCLPPKQMSEAERRPLEQKPALSGKDLLSGSFMKDFEDYTLDQFPMRDTFRSLKARFHFGVLNQSDNNDIYLVNGVAVGQEYPLNPDSVSHAADRFQAVYDRYLAQSGGNIYLAVVPDKGYYLAGTSGHLSLDYDEMTRLLAEKLPWAEGIDLTAALSEGDYYRTDTHWRQEKLLEAASVICQAMGAEVPRQEDYTPVILDRPFYGVYYGQAALPLAPDALWYLDSALLQDCAVYDYETGKTGQVYDMTKLESKDLYEVFLSGSKSLLRIDNPNAKTDRELIIFRDSFGSAMAPLLVQGYKSVTLVDIRYIQSAMLSRFLEFEGKDVLFLYSTLVLNNSSAIK